MITMKLSDWDWVSEKLGGSWLVPAYWHIKLKLSVFFTSCVSGSRVYEMFHEIFIKPFWTMIEHSSLMKQRKFWYSQTSIIQTSIMQIF